MPEPAPPDQQSYWNSNLDPQNLGKAQPGTRFDWRKELAYYATPDQMYALRQLVPLSGKWILEIGAGLGINAIKMAADGARVVAIDIAHDRLMGLGRQHKDLVSNVATSGTLYLVKAAAEALPFRDNALDGACSKSVLIHTQLEAVVPEIARVLKPAGVGTFIEPLTQNPFVNLYRRTLAPKIWQSIARYFDEPELELFRRAFSNIEIRRFYFFGFFAFVWQFGLKVPALFWATMGALKFIDALLMRMPAVAQRAWFAVIVVRK